jgi:hypothetical protein
LIQGIFFDLKKINNLSYNSSPFTKNERRSSLIISATATKKGGDLVIEVRAEGEAATALEECDTTDKLSKFLKEWMDKDAWIAYKTKKAWRALYIMRASGLAHLMRLFQENQISIKIQERDSM